MKTKLFTLFVALIATTALWASNVITYTATKKLEEETGDEMNPGLHPRAFNSAIISHEFSNGIGTITFADEVTTISRYAFNRCKDLISIDIPSSVTLIGYRAFYSCLGLTSVTIPNSVTEIKEEAFRNCGLTSVTIPNSVTTIGESAFSGLTSVTINSNSIVGKSYSYDYQLKNNLKNIFGEQVSEYILGNSITEIGTNAFADCDKLASITIPNSVKWIGERAFYDCDGLTSITIPNSVTGFGDDAFNGCGLTSIVIPKHVKSIGKGVFKQCVNLTSIIIPNSVKWIGDGAFESCKHLTSVVIPDSVITIGNHAFSDCYDLTSITIGNSVTAIGEAAFENCYGLTSVSIGNSVKTIGSYAFNGCGLTSIVIPNSVNRIGERAFWSCGGLTSVTLPNSVTTIEEGTFLYCGLISITIPRSVTKIKDLAFCGCRGLTSIQFDNIVPPVFEGYNIFNEVPVSVTIIVPCGYVSNYKSKLSRFINYSSFGDFPYVLTVSSSDNTIGSTESTIPDCVTNEATIKATPIYGYHLDHWSDNYFNSINPRTLVVTEDIKLVAYFAKNIYKVTTHATHGQVQGNKEVIYLDTCILTAIPNEGYEFVDWSNGITDNPYSFIVEQDVELTANFKKVDTGWQDVYRDTKVSKFFHNGSIVIERNGNLYNAQGNIIK